MRRCYNKDFTNAAMHFILFYFLSYCLCCVVSFCFVIFLVMFGAVLVLDSGLKTGFAEIFLQELEINEF